MLQAPYSCIGRAVLATSQKATWLLDDFRRAAKRSREADPGSSEARPPSRDADQAALARSVVKAAVQQQIVDRRVGGRPDDGPVKPRIIDGSADTALNM